MSSDRRILALGLVALTTAACMSRQSPQPPAFPEGGLVGRSTPPPNPWSLQKALDGVYDTSSRFGSNVVVHSSQWGGVNPGTEMKASVSILAYDHFAFAIMQPGCFVDTTGATPQMRLVLEGYWRYLDASEPSPESTGLVRLFVSPPEIIKYVCGVPGELAPAWDRKSAPGDSRPVPTDAQGQPIRASFTGSTGNGVNAPGSPLTVSWVRARKSRLNADGKTTFFVGVHHGGCQSTDNCGISENTPETSILATQLGGGYLEIDIHLTKDKVPVFFHLGLNPSAVQGLYCVGKVEDYTYDELLANCRLTAGEIIPRVSDMLEFIYTRTDFPTYLDSKSTDIIVPVSQILGQLQEKLVPCNPKPPGSPEIWPPEGKKCLFPGSAQVWERGIIGLPAAEYVTAYQQALIAKQLAPNQHCLVEENSTDVTAVPCVAWMPRYTRGPMTSEVQSLQQGGYVVGYWTINDPATIDAFLTTAVPNGILTNYLGLLNQRFEMVGTTPPYTPSKVSTP
jgi:glycerophosphoryl diester phosphodiesterase